jgi:serine acetyltransferase
LAGGGRIGAVNHIGIGAAISHGTAIGSHSAAGAGSAVIKNCPDQVVLFGVSGEVVSERAIGESGL